jgi:hypothetical protein
MQLQHELHPEHQFRRDARCVREDDAVAPGSGATLRRVVPRASPRPAEQVMCGEAMHPSERAASMRYDDSRVGNFVEQLSSRVGST